MQIQHQSRDRIKSGSIEILDSRSNIESGHFSKQVDQLTVSTLLVYVWKESLGELSGGQSTLVPLSLVLEMLLFKLAPLYIMNEALYSS
ncbi:unnamed protein product [Euphydryas editha]|uniref:Uncharacterized protein n=1 Tax=Euphydryas editha TaxID=104508 RepID=A0AAU9UB58_EUPED|nr:unnamed protein product [Euphydryas editha]